MKGSPQEAEWRYTDHLRGVILVVMSLLALVFAMVSGWLFASGVWKVLEAA